MSIPTIPVSKINPYNIIGTLHNSGLDFFANNAPYNYTMDNVFSLSAISTLNDTKGLGNYTNDDIINLSALSAATLDVFYLPDTSDPISSQLM